MPARISRAAYAGMFGPTTGDRLRLADTELVIEVERDLTTYGEEVKFGGGKVIRDGMGQSQVTRAQGAVDTVITNALIVDHTGIYKADVGLRDGRICAIGKAGNPDVQPGVDIIVGPGTPAGRGRAALGRHHAARRGRRPLARDAGDHLHAGALAYRTDAAGARRAADQFWIVGEGECVPAGGAGRDGQGRRLRAEAA